MTTSEHVWTDDADEQWADAFTLAAARLPAVRHGDIMGWLDEVHTAVGDSEVSAEALYGTPDEAAEHLPAGMPIARRAAVDAEGMTPREAADGVLMTMGAFLLGLAVWGFATRGWSLDVTAPAAALVAIVVPLGTGGWTTALLLRRNGRLRASWLAAATVTLLAAVAMASTLLVADPDQVVVTVPVLAVGALGLVTATLGWFLPTPDAVVDDRSRDWPADQWYLRLEGVLRGRHGVARTAARTAIEETRSYVEESGAPHPYNEFGAPEIHALHVWKSL
ncbi:hypothetical protein [Aeromicrobium stalagmiti]|uniref:hypothetical protein n=1 Tax=Aeromicrobium stalagmiti TaxID=2738988 RepID=UPI00156A6A5D|nr:hypothetical protein [Aeromicrobium stalagmiti]NRQ51626.1 hypothetical protein [Aeromicrobium stalagmiti]